MVEPLGDIDAARGQGRGGDHPFQGSLQDRLIEAVGADPESEASERICATVLSFDTQTGRISTGLSSSQETSTATGSSRLGTRRDREPGGQNGVNGQRNIDRNQQRLVGERIEIGAEFRAQIEFFGDKAVDRVGNAGQEKIRNASGNRCDMIIMTARGVINIRASVMRLGILPRMLRIFIKY